MADDPEPKPNDDPDEPLGEGGIKALNAERDARREAEKALKDMQAQIDDLKPAAERLKEIEDQQKSDLDKANERLAELEGKAAKADTERLRYQIALKHEITEEDAQLWLTATSEEDLTKQAERFAELRGTEPKKQPDPGQGPRPPKPKNPWEEGRKRAQRQFGTPG